MALENLLYSRMDAPYLVQRAKVALGSRSNQPRFSPDDMGSVEFELGAPEAALNAIFQSGWERHQVTVSADGEDTKLHLIVRKGFSVAEYTPYLARLANDSLSLHDPAYLLETIRQRKGKNSGLHELAHARFNAWFDINNAVISVLSQEEADMLEAALNDIKETW